MVLLSTNHLNTLEPVLDCLLQSGAANACARLILHLEDRLLTTLLKCLHSLLHPFHQRRLKFPTQDTPAIRQALLPHKRTLLRLAEPGEPSRKRTQLARALRRERDLAPILASFLRTLKDLISASKRKNTAEAAN